jgi:predicted acyltransferase
MQLKATQRSESLDALRGLAILMMVLSGAIPFDGVLPGWMYHAQEPPPLHVFRPDIPGITWVDMVFPFFIFSMGAAIPFAISSRLRRGESLIRIGRHTIFRWVALSLFAFFIYYIRPWIVTDDSAVKWIICLLGFVFLFATFIKLPKDFGIKNLEKGLNIGGAIMLSSLIYWLNSSGRIQLSFQSFDIIIMILACISLFGGAFQMVSKGSVSILAFFWVLITSFYLSGKMTDSWTNSIWNYSPAPWLLSWEYLKYLMILIPGMWAGNTLKDFHQSFTGDCKENKKSLSLVAALVLLSVNICIICGLYTRESVPVFLYTVAGLLIVFFVVKKWQSEYKPLIIKLLYGGAFFTISGLLVEPMQGGIKKDPATLGYLVLTPGMALLMLVFFIIIIDLKKKQKAFFLLTGSGKNAMLAYFTGSNFILPLFALCGINSVISLFSNQALWQTIIAVVITLLVAWLSAIAAKKKFLLKA